MQYRSSIHPFPEYAGPAVVNAAFVPVPAFLMVGLGWGACQLYRQVWSQVVASAGPQPLRIRVADLPRSCRN